MRIIALVATGFLVAACAATVTTSEIQLRRDTWQIRAEGRGILADGKTVPALYKRAAALTVEQGYSYFQLSPPETSGTVSTSGYTPLEANVLGDYVYYSGGQPIRSYYETSTVVVSMSHGPEGGGLSAHEVLARAAAAAEAEAAAEVVEQ